MMMHNHVKHQTGVALIVSLIFLLLMTMIGVSGIKNTVIEEKMAGNYKDRNLAFQSAEAALRQGESYLYTTAILPIFTEQGNNGLYKPTISGLARWNTDIWDSGAITYPSSKLSGLASQPRYIIEELDGILDTEGSLSAGNKVTSRYYRITAKAQGGTSAANVTLQSTYKRN